MDFKNAKNETLDYVISLPILHFFLVKHRRRFSALKIKIA